MDSESALKSKARRRSAPSSSSAPSKSTRRPADAPAPPASTRAYLLAAAVGIVVIGAIGVFTWRSFSHRGQSIVVGQYRGDNVLLVTIDTLRRDRLGVYGDPDGLTPNLDRLASGGVRFDDAFTEVPETLPAHTSILTGLTPIAHGIHNNGTFRLGPGPATLASTFKKAGYQTAAFVSAFVLDARYGLNRGFDLYDDYFGHRQSASTFDVASRPAPETLAPALAWIEGGSTATAPPAPQPWFVWVHLFDPHAPYHAPPEFAKGHTPYDAGVAYTDAMLGRFLDQLRSRGILQHTVVVVMADHGESLGDHGELTHGLFAYNATLKIPLILSAPGLHPQVVSRLVANIDVMPTLLALTGVPIPAGLDGHSLISVLNDDARKPAPPVYFEALDANLTRGWAPLRGVISGHWKYIDLPIPELYDLARDPGETHNLASADAEKTREMKNLLREVMAKDKLVGGGPQRVMSADAEARLQSLGYVSGDNTTKKIYTAADDPKNLVALNAQFTAALEQSSTGHLNRAVTQLEAVLAKWPTFETARTSAADILLTENRTADAVTLLNAAPGGVAHSPELLAKLGAALRQSGDRAGAAKAFEEAIAAGSQDPDVYNDLGVTYVEMGQLAQARAMFSRVLTFDPTSAGAWNNLGILAMHDNDTQAAVHAFRQAVHFDPTYGEAWHGLGAALINSDPAAAVDAWRHAAALLPDDYDLLYNLGVVLSRSSQPADGLPYLKRFVAVAPPAQYGPDIARIKALIAKIEQMSGK